MKLSGVLDLKEKGKVHCEQSELEDLGELGHGTCGQVFTMKHKSTGQIMAVKVSIHCVHNVNLFLIWSCLLVAISCFVKKIV